MNSKEHIAIKPKRRLQCIVTQDKYWVEKAQQLRYRIFAKEMGANLHSDVEGLDCDIIDEYCDHLLVIDNSSNRVVGYTRLLNQHQADKLGRFYSQSEFNIDNILAMPGRFLEIGRTCIDPAFRGSAVLTTLWSALGKYAQEGGYDYLIGCASIPPGPNGYSVDAVFNNIDDKNKAPNTLNVSPVTPVPKHLRCLRDESGIPPLVSAYLRFGVLICGEPCWDPDFNVMDLFIMLPLQSLGERYTKRYMKTPAVINESQSQTLI